MGGSAPISTTRHKRLGAPLPFVIVADGDPAVRHSLRFLLEIEGYAVAALSNSSAVLEHPDVRAAVCLIIDLDLPGMNGLELVTVLRARHPAIPAILMASNADKQILSRSQTSGVQVVEKPIFGDVLGHAIKAATSGR
jgi:two-component system response regulator FixJ